MKMIIVIGMLIGSLAHAEEKASWFCTEESGKREGNVMWACGVGEATTEADARHDALERALGEFHVICLSSAGCEIKYATVEPKRMTCTESKKAGLDWWKCYRLVEIVFAKR